MNKQAIIFEVSERSFDKYVIGNSDKAPVFVLFMNVWAEPCIQAADMFSALAKKFAGQFILAKVDIDENKALVERFEIENVPTLKVFIDGKVSLTEVGQISEDEARAC